MGMLSARAKFTEIAERVRSSILSGELKVGDRLKPDDALALEHHVDKRTVAKGMNQLLREGFLERAPGRGTIVISNSAKAERGKAVGLVMGDESRGYGGLVKEIVAQLTPLSYVPVLVDYVVVDPGERMVALVDNLNRQNPVGYILDGVCHLPLEYLERHARDMGTLVFILRYHYERKIPGAKYALLDYRGAGRLAAEHLIRNGHVNIHFLPIPEHRYIGDYASVQAQIMRGFKEACQEGGVNFDEGLFWDSFLARRKPEEVLDMLLQGAARRTGLLVYYDSVACMEVIPALRRRGLGVPDDISLIGFNNTDSAAQFDLTSVSLCQEQVARCAFELLMGHRKEESLLVPTALVERGSVKDLRSQLAKNRPDGRMRKKGLDYASSR